jgi:hypothetical protein
MVADTVVSYIPYLTLSLGSMVKTTAQVEAISDKELDRTPIGTAEEDEEEVYSTVAVSGHIV